MSTGTLGTSQAGMGAAWICEAGKEEPMIALSGTKDMAVQSQWPVLHSTLHCFLCPGMGWS